MTTRRFASSQWSGKLANLLSGGRALTGKQYKQTQGKPVPIAMKPSMRSLLLQAVILLLGATMCLRPAQAQTVNASLSGIVSDQNGARLVSASVTLVNEATRDTRKTKTNGDGVYEFQSVPPGTYTLQLAHKGFSTYTEGGIELHPADERTLAPVKLYVGSVTESVTVTANNEIDTSPERSSLITAADIRKLSTVGRDASELLKTQPGFAMAGGTGAAGLNNGLSSDPSVVGSGGSGLANYVGNGAPGNGASVISDGANVTDPGNESGQTQTVNMDMVSEIKIETSNFGADTAKGPTVITAVGKAGGADYHGTVYGFARTSQMNAEDWFLKYLQLPQIADRYIYPGFGIGGPVRIPGTNFNHNKKLTFYVSGEDYVQRNVYAYGTPLDSFITALVPTDESTNKLFNLNGAGPGMRQGNFTQDELANYLGMSVTDIYANCTSSGTEANYYHVCAAPYTADGTIGSSGGSAGQFANGAASFNPGSRALLNGEFPLPTGPTVNGYNWRSLNLENPDSYQIYAKVSIDPTDNDKMYAVYNGEKGRTSGIPEQIYYSPASGGTLMGGLDTPGKIISINTSNTGSLNYSHIFSVRATNELYGAVSYVANYFTSADPNALLKSTIGYPYNGIYTRSSCTGCGSDDFPQLSDYGNDGLPLAITPDFSNGRYISKKFLPSGGDNFTLQIGAHTLKFGTYIERDTADQTDLSPITNGQITNYYVPSGSLTDTLSDGTQVKHDTVGCAGTNFSGQDCGDNYLADFMLGNVDQFFQENFNPKTNMYYWTISGFVQDSWKVNSKLTVDLGVRADHLSAWTDSYGVGIAAFSSKWYAEDAPVRGVTSATALPGLRWHKKMPSVPLSGDKTRLAFISPRFGLSYDLFGNGKTILRGGWGMYRSHDSWNDFSYAAATSQGLVTSSVGGAGVNLGDIDSMSAVGPGQEAQGLVCDSSGTTGCPSISALDPSDDEQPLTMTYSFTVSQQAPWKSAFEIAYVGNQSQDLLTDSEATTIPSNIQNINAIPMDAMFKPDPNPNSSYYGQVVNPDATSVAQQNDYRPFPFYTDILVPRHIVWANYNALQTSWNKQSGHLNYGINYTFSKALGVRGGYNNGLTADPTNLTADYGPLAFDRTQVFNASYSYDEGDLLHKGRLLDSLANNWFISGITNVQSGPNLQAVYSPNLALKGVVTNGPSTNSPANSGNGANIDSSSLLGTPDIYLMPALKCDPTKGLGKNQFINGNCFTLAPLGINGPSNFGYLRGPKFLNSDLTLQKRVVLSDRRNLEFRVSAFNFLNHPITSFSSRYTNEASLELTGSDYADVHLQNGTNNGASCSAWGSQCFGYAGYKTGRRVMEISARFNF